MSDPQCNPDILAALAPEYLRRAYSHGWFPMVEFDELYWFNPPVRGALPLDDRFHISHSLAKTIRRGTFTCTIDRAFGAVMAACANRPEGTWISPEMLVAYGRLHDLGLAHSVEAWPADSIGRGEPVGGVYGVAIGGAFFAESMFHRTTDAGKVALAYLVERLRACGFVMCDIQWTTDNLKRFGAFDILQASYLPALKDAIVRDCKLRE